jgi:hypothetical protein
MSSTRFTSTPRSIHPAAAVPPVWLFYCQTISHVTNSIEPSTPWESASRSATQELQNILWNTKVYYRNHIARHWPLFRPAESSPVPTHPRSLRSICSIILLSWKNNSNLMKPPCYVSICLSVYPSAPPPPLLTWIAAEPVFMKLFSCIKATEPIWTACVINLSLQ